MSRNESCMSGTRLCWIFYARDKRRSPFQSFALTLALWEVLTCYQGSLACCHVFCSRRIVQSTCPLSSKRSCGCRAERVLWLQQRVQTSGSSNSFCDTPGYYGYDSAPSLHHAPSRPLHKASHRNSRLSGWHGWRNAMTRFSWTHGPSIVLY